MSADQQEAAIKGIGNISTLLREAIGKAIPVAPDSYLTIAIPGTVIDTTDVEQGGSFVYDTSKTVLTPTSVRQAEAKLVDNMIPLANIMIGNTGKSVARSYARALDTLVPRKAEIAMGDELRSPGDPLYVKAMSYLTTHNPDTGLTPIDVYTRKQRKWAAAQDAWDLAKEAALKSAQQQYPNDNSKALQAYNDWNQTHFRKYKASAQAEWMDWVANGDKYAVENFFGIIDVDSIMARVEDSKESMRNSSLIDVDGANEVQGVELTPKEWATYCRKMNEGWYSDKGKYSVEDIDAEIARLKTLLASYNAMEALATKSPPEYPGAVQPTQAQNNAESDVEASLSSLLTAQANLNKNSDSAQNENLVTALNSARKDLADKQKVQQDAMAAINRYKLAVPDASNQNAIKDWIESRKSTVNDQITQLRDARTQVRDSPYQLPVIIGAHADGDAEGDKSSGNEVAPPDAEYAKPIFGLSRPGALPTQGLGPWTAISCSYSAQDQSKEESESSWGMSVGGGVGFGLWSVGGNYAHDQSQKDMRQDMANCDVSVTFQALVVNIRRPWLYGELFADGELDSGTNLSPGAESLQALLKSQQINDLAQYSTFPAYPTSFIVAANTEIEFVGNTTHMESHMQAQSNSGGVSVGYGPWSVSSSFHQSNSNSSFRMSSTSTGCKLSFGSPQIIGWVSQILPRLPRQRGFNEMVQNVVAVNSTS